MTSSRTLTALALVLATPAMAVAADLPARVAAPVPVLSPVPVSGWAGFYAGSVYGVGYGSFRSSQTGSRTLTKWGQTGGGLLGYNMQSGAFVYGLEGDMTMDVIRGSNPGTTGLVAHDVDTLHTSRIRGRIGYDLGSFLPFVAGGVAFNETYVYNGPTAALDYGQVKNQTGVTLGAGVDWKFLAPFFGPMVLRAEYVYDGYGAQNYLSGGNGTVGGASVRVKSSTQYMRLALINKFDDNWHAPVSADLVDWSGAYGGIIGGGFQSRATTTLGAASTTVTATGPAFGIYAGRNWQFGNYVLGLDSASTLTNATGSSALPGSATGQLNFRNYIQADIRGRVGYSLGRLLPFFAAGASFGRSEQRDLTTGSERGRIPTETWTVGAGADYMLTDRFSLRGEYLFERTVKTREVDLDGTAYTQKRDGQTVRVGIAYHFH